MGQSRDFLTKVAEPNIDEFEKAFWHQRSAVNAVVTFDCLLGIIHWEATSAGLPVANQDSVFRNDLAARHGILGVVRDAAFALKHGKLTRGTRLVSKADQVKGQVPTLSDGFFLDRDFVGVEVIMIE